MSSENAMDVSNAEMQDEIANSLLGEPEAVEQTAEEQGGQFEAEEFDPHSQDHFVSDEIDRAGEFFDEGTQQHARQPAQSEQTQQPAEAMPQSIEESIQALDQTVQEYQLNDPVDAKELATDLCDAFGTSVYDSGVNTEAIGSVMAKVGLSALNAFEATGGDPSKLPAISPESAKAFTYDFLKSWGVDPRTVEVDAQLLSNTVFCGALNFIATYRSLGGRVTEMARLNDPQAAEQFAGQFLRAFGVEGPIDRASALKLADAGAKHLLKLIARVEQIQPQQPARPQRRASASRSSGQQRSSSRPERAPGKGSGRSTRFQTNTDLFDDDTMNIYRREHGRL
jgi:hypothetical protein